MNVRLHEAVNNHQLWLLDKRHGHRLEVRKQIIRNVDFTSYNLSGAIFSHCMLDGSTFGHVAGTLFVGSGGTAKFTGNVSQTSFEKAHTDLIRGLIGATWHGTPITKVTDWVVQTEYWAFRTDAFVQIGCMQRTLEEWNRLGFSPENLKELHLHQPNIDLEMTYKWWQENKLMIWSSMS
jgi:hypothetical protein